MFACWIRPPHGPPLPLDQAHPEVRVGRSLDNDVSLEDISLSRHHARFRWTKTGVGVEDLGSRNGTLVNGVAIQGLHPLALDDRVSLGKHTFTVTGQGEDLGILEVPQGTVMLSVDKLRGTVLVPGTGEVLGIIHAVSLALVGNGSVQDMLKSLLERLFAHLRPDRGAILLRDPDGSMRTVAVQATHVRHALRQEISRTMVQAAIERREAMLVNDPHLDERLGQAESILGSALRSIMTVPLEHEGEVVGLVYFDAGITRVPFHEGDLQLVAILGHLAAAKIRAARMAEEVRIKLDLERDMALARQIQERILPGPLPDLPPFEMFGHNVPCRRVSGDLYGYWPRPDGKAWLAIADVSGKGIGPGLLMATFQAYLQAWAELDLEPAALAAKLAFALEARTSSHHFVTAFLALLDPHTATVSYTNAGHNPPLWIRRDGAVESLGAQGLPIPMFPDRGYGQGRLAMEPGDLLFLYTDGITEAEDPEGREQDPHGLAHLLRAQGDAPLKDLHGALTQALDAHTQGAPLADDRTVVLLRRRG